MLNLSLLKRKKYIDNDQLHIWLLFNREGKKDMRHWSIMGLIFHVCRGMGQSTWCLHSRRVRFPTFFWLESQNSPPLTKHSSERDSYRWPLTLLCLECDQLLILIKYTIKIKAQCAENTVVCRHRLKRVTKNRNCSLILRIPAYLESHSFLLLPCLMIESELGRLLAWWKHVVTFEMESFCNRFQGVGRNLRLHNSVLRFQSAVAEWLLLVGFLCLQNELSSMNIQIKRMYQVSMHLYKSRWMISIWGTESLL